MTSAPIVISFKHVSKTFHFRDRNADSIRKRVMSLFSGSTKKRTLTALKDINVEIRKGEFIGIVGSNGSGKSTFLKLIIGALRPDKGGQIKTEGRIVRLALGMGFDENLSARDNIYLNGSIIGLTFRQIGDRFQDIVSFADLQDFVDTPIKLFSSGMVSRLAFAIALHVEADILLIDEFFVGVGDKKFKAKSNQAFRNFINSGKTILFVSHEIDQLRTFADRVAVFEKGSLVVFDEAEKVLEKYAPPIQESDSLND